MYALVLSISFLVFSNIWVVRSTRDNVLSAYDKLPDHRVALVLGTSNKTTAGQPNQFFEKRMDTAAQLYKIGKIDHFILSGDNRSKFYNEPVAMRKALISRGVPTSAITLDFAGLRTLRFSCSEVKKCLGRIKSSLSLSLFIVIELCSLVSSMILMLWQLLLQNLNLKYHLKSEFVNTLPAQKPF